ncbi:MAG TPA: MarR family transcriptional regulator [Acidimicrobiales bacterium]|jgi:DNA-binding MarR family transcriptional regulator|nr:MarR family transcriptional regulator [Acidimicrobiales bacterium]
MATTEAGEDLVKDQVDAVVDFWSQENPSLDLLVRGLAIRLRRVAHHLERSLREQLGTSDIEMWEAEVLLALRRGAEHCRSAGELLKDIQVTSGAISNRVARLEERGWVRRDVDPADRRHVLVSLTPEGLARADALLASKAQAELAVLGRLDREAQERLNNDLRTLLLALEGPAQPGDESLKLKRAELAP